MFLIGAIKPIAEKKFKTFFYFLRDCLGRVVGRVRNKTSFVSLRYRFGGVNKNFFQKKGEKYFLYCYFYSINSFYNNLITGK